jgi:toluene monooxygenase system protein D
VSESDLIGVGVGVGPVLQSTPLAAALAAVMEGENDRVIVRDEGAYLRVLSPRICRLSRAAVEAATGSPFRFPGDLEMIMSSFSGLVQMNEHGAVWWLATDPVPEPPRSPPQSQPADR